MKEYILATFESSNFAMQAESYFKKNNIKNQIIPTPREITLSCGLSLVLPVDKVNKISDAVDKKDITIKSLFKVTGNAENRKIEKMDF